MLHAKTSEAFMKFMVEFRLRPGHKEQVLAEFERVGPNRQDGVAFRGAWVGSHSDIIFVLAESADEARLAEVAKSWSVHGELTLHAVVDVNEL
jgi:hypothetical protein